jgi:glucosyl-3-phosphoglycerate synthase
LKLVYPIAVFDGHFNKGYYARFSDNKLDGRLTRLLVFPLLDAIQAQHPANELLQWLLAFRYPLSGDVSFSSQLIPQLNLAAHWAYDLSLLTSVYDKQQALDVYQTELSDNYEHLHRRIEKNGESGLMGVAQDIVDYLTALINPLDKTRLVADYYRLAKQYSDKYQKLALFNGLFYAQETEMDLIKRIINYLQYSSSAKH